MRYRVIQEHCSNYPNPLHLPKGCSLQLVQQCDIQEWQGWTKCRSGDQCGWVPDVLIKLNGESEGYLLEDYCARELNVRSGQVFHAEKELNGWAWGYLQDEPRLLGWLPLLVLEKL